MRSSPASVRPRLTAISVTDSRKAKRGARQTQERAGWLPRCSVAIRKRNAIPTMKVPPTQSQRSLHPYCSTIAR